MANVEIYTSSFCPFCHRAKRLLDEKGVRYNEVDVTFDRSKRAEMAAKAGRATVPQIWIDGKHIGGSQELYALEREGRLDGMLRGAA